MKKTINNKSLENKIAVLIDGYLTLLADLTSQLVKRTQTNDGNTITIKNSIPEKYVPIRIIGKERIAVYEQRTNTNNRSNTNP